MKKLFRGLLVLLIVLLATVSAVSADRGGRDGYYRHGTRGGYGGYGGSRVGIGVTVGPGWWWPGGWDAYPYYPYYPPAPVVIQQPPEIYLQQAPAVEKPQYRYFCPDPQGYYPEIPKCPKGWLKVVPPADVPEGKE